MSDPKTKTVLGRVFTPLTRETWACETKHGLLMLWWAPGASAYIAALAPNEDESEMVRALGPTESDAILALQSTLRKMAMLEVAE